jgi:predicted RNA-binding protein YlxR (DUF448 family)
VNRTCIGCRAIAAPPDLVRLVAAPEGELVFDLARRTFGRGAWLHPDPGCLARAARGGVDRAFRQPFGLNASSLTALFREAANRRAFQLIGAARRAQKLGTGSAAVAEAIERREVELVIVAIDASAAAAHPFLEPLIASGRALAFGTKTEFATCLGRTETTLLAVTEARLAREIRRAIEWAQLPDPAAARAARTISSEAG